MEQISNKRLDFIDACKGIGIFLIVFGHIMPEVSGFTKYISTYKISIFYILAGIIICYKGEVAFEVHKKFVTLVKPYIYFSLLVILYNMVVRMVLHSGENFLGLLKEDFIITISFRGISTLWFLPTLFLGELIFHKTRKIVILKILIGLSPIWVTIITNECTLKNDFISYIVIVFMKSIIASWFIYIGYYVFSKMRQIKNARLEMVGIMGVIFSVATMFLSQINTEMDFNNLIFGKVPYVFFLGGVMGAWGIILVLICVFSFKEKNRIGKILCYFGKNSLIIMLTHLPFPIVKICLIIVNRLFKINYNIQCIIAFTLVLLIEVVLIEFTNRYLKKLIGKK